MSEQGIRSVLGNLLSHVRDFDIPPADTPEYAAFIDRWADRLMKAAGFFREREVVARSPRPPDPSSDGDDMCPNCVTPWKCNGPHIWQPA